MRPDEFFTDPEPGLGKARLRTSFLRELRVQPAEGMDDAEVGAALAQVVHDELDAYGTDGSTSVSNGDIRDAITTLHAIADRLGIDDFKVPFRDFSGFHSYWVRKGAKGSWQARRDLLEGIFGSLHNQLEDLELKSLTSTLAEPVSPAQKTSWRSVDQEIIELRRHFQSARSPQDYRNIGNDCAKVLEAVSREAYSADRHLRDDEEEPPIDKTKQRLGRVVEDAFPGAKAAPMRKLITGAIETAQAVKHSDTPNRREAGLAADSVILVANLIRRAVEE